MLGCEWDRGGKLFVLEDVTIPKKVAQGVHPKKNNGKRDFSVWTCWKMVELFTAHPKDDHVRGKIVHYSSCSIGAAFYDFEYESHRTG